MLAIPRIDVRGGLAVRPAGAGETDVGVVLGDPVGVVRGLAQLGFQRVHVADADALLGSGFNSDVIEEVIRDGSADIQVSDGANSADQIERFLAAGAARIVVGSRGLEDRDWLAGVADLYPGLLLVASEVRERRIVTRGWVRTLPLDVLDLAADLGDLPLGGLLICRSAGDGARSLDLSLLEDIAETSQCAVFADATHAAASDLRALEHRGIAGALLGGSLYGGELDARRVALEFAE